MSTASHRIAERSWRRFMPTARSSPSSRVRSLIDSDRVLAMPIRAMMIDRSKQPVDDGDERRDLVGRGSR